MTANAQTQSPQPHGVFNYMAADTPASLLRNGQVMIQRDPSGNTTASAGIRLDPHSVPVFNARELPAAEQPGLDINGFELQHQPLPDAALDFHHQQTVLAEYYPQCAALVSRITGARAYAFDHNVRSAAGKQSGRRISGGQDVQEPAHVVHGDYTLRSAPERLQQLTRPPSGNDTLLGTLPAGVGLLPAGSLKAERFAIINVWRNIAAQPVATHPMALCDGQTVLPEDLVVFEIHYPDRVGENYFAKFSPAHRLYTYPQMTRDEVLLIKQWDSAGNLARTGGAGADAEQPAAPCTFSFHSAFEDPRTPPDAPDRWSIEVRCMVVYD